MPSINDNLKMFGNYDWSRRGHEWSTEWASTPLLWQTELFPRLGFFLPAGSILEIAPGYGRITAHLLSYCEKLYGIDINQNCVDACNETFKGLNCEFHKNDGLLFDMIPDNSIDFCFSWDSLVHVDDNVIRSYLVEIKRVLKDGGYAFLHHSNLAEYVSPAENVLVENLGWRSSGVSGDLVADEARRIGMRAVSTEKFVWSSNSFTDCISVLCNRSDDVGRSVLYNPFIKDHAQYVRALSSFYNTGSQGCSGVLPSSFASVFSHLASASCFRKLVIAGDKKRAFEISDMLKKVYGVDDDRMECQSEICDDFDAEKYYYIFCDPTNAAKSAEKADGAALRERFNYTVLTDFPNRL